MQSTAAGYSGTPLPKKLGLKPESRLLIVDDPADFYATLEHSRSESDEYDVIVWFVTERRILRNGLSARIGLLADRGGLWIAWPKRASRVPTDITENTLRDEILPLGLVDNKVCAIDETWSGLRFVRRLKH